DGAAVVVEREVLVVVLRVEGECGAHLAAVGDAGDGARLLAGLGEDREEDGGQDGYDGDYYQQFDQGKCASLRHGLPPALRSVRRCAGAATGGSADRSVPGGCTPVAWLSQRRAECGRRRRGDGQF